MKSITPSEGNLILNDEIKNLKNVIKEDNEGSVFAGEPELSTSCLKVQKQLSNGKWHHVGEIPVPSDDKVDLQEILLEQENWGGAGNYRLSLCDYDGNRLPGFKVTHINVPGEKIVDIEDNNEELSEEEKKIAEAKANLEVLKLKRSQKEIIKDIEILDNTNKPKNEIPSLKDIENVVKNTIIEKPQNTDLLSLMFQQAQQTQALLISIINKKPDTSPIVEFAKSLTPLIPAILQSLKKEERQPSQFENLIPQLIPTLLNKVMEPKQDLLSVVGPLIQANSTMNQQAVNEVIKTMSEINKMKFESENSDTNMQKLSMIMDLIRNTTKPLIETLNHYLISKSLANKNSVMPIDNNINALPKPDPNNYQLPPNVPKEVMIAKDIIDTIVKLFMEKKEVNEIYGYLIKNYPKENLKMVANDPDLEKIIVTLPENESKEISRILTAIRES